jgi:hypothetical protein
MGTSTLFFPTSRFSSSLLFDRDRLARRVFSARFCSTLLVAPVFDVCSRMRGHHSRSDEDDLEGGRVFTTSGDTRLLTCYSYLFERGLRAPWKLFGYCTLVVSQAIVRHRRK